MNLILIQCLALFCTVLSVGINLPPLSAFPDLEDAVGLHTFTLSERTPQTIYTTTLYILLNKSEEDSITIGNGCPANSTLCAITKIDLNNGEEPIITKKFSVSENYTSIHSSPYRIGIRWENQVWGELSVNIRLHMQCLHDDSSDNTDSLEWHGGYAGIRGSNYLRWRSKSFCDTASSGGNNKGWGLFSKLSLVIIIALAGYLIAKYWCNPSKMGSSSECFNELKLSKIPQLIGKVINYFASP